MRQFFDAIVLSSDIGCLLTGALLAKGGLRVLAHAPARARNGYLLAGVPCRRTAQFFPSWEATPSMKKTLFELNLISDMHRRLKPNRPAYQVVFADERVDVGLSAETFGAEVDRVWPTARDRTATFFETRDASFADLNPFFEAMPPLVPAGFSERRALSKALDRVPAALADIDLASTLGDDAMLRAALLAPLEFASNAAPDARTALDTRRLAGLFRGGIFRLPHDIDDLRDLLLTAIREHAGTVVEGAPGIAHVSWGSVKGIVERESGDFIGCNFVVGPTRAAAFDGVLPEGRKARSLNASLREIRAAARRFSVNLVVAIDVIPDGMFDDLFLVDDPAKPFTDANLIHVSLGEVVGDVRSVTLDCLVHLPREDGDGDDTADRPPNADALARRLVEAFRRLVPFLDRGLRAVDVPWGEPTKARAHLVPWRDAPVQYVGKPRGALGMFGVPFETPFKNLFVVGVGSFPALGIEGLFHAALDLAIRIHRAAGKKDILS